MTSVDQKKKPLDLAQRIRSARENAHFSQHELGSHIGVSDKSISAYEKGRSQPPLSNLQKIASATRHPLAYFTDESTDVSEISAKLQSIERELAEVKLLLQKTKTKEK